MTRTLDVVASIARPPRPLRAWLAVPAILAGLLAAPPVSPDDRDLLKFKATKPYLFILLDTSASMNLKFGANTPAEGHGDDPTSRLWGAKEALFTVFKDVEDVHFGFAAMNQDATRVHTVHWLYYLESLPGSWPFQGAGAPIEWPLPDPDGLTTDNPVRDIDGDGVPDIGDGIPDGDVEGDTLVFGETFLDATGAAIPGGTCAEPLPLDTERGRAQVNAYAKTGANGLATTTVWFSLGKGGSARVYRLQIERPGNRPDGSTNAALGRDNLHVKFHLSGPVSDCAAVPSPSSHNFSLRLDPELDRFVMIDRGEDGFSGGNNPTEHTAALWPWTDAEDDMDCGDSHPFTGKGWEGNYDSGVGPPEGVVTDVDAYCADENGDGTETCVELRPVEQTVPNDEFGFALDHGDMMPFKWWQSGSNRDAMLQRLAPNWPEETPHFGVTHHLSDLPDPDTGVLAPRLAGREPLVARNDTPLNMSINDVRCWYLGRKGRNSAGKCGASAYFQSDGWSGAACQNDPDYGCRRPFFIIISDGVDVCMGEDATSDVSDLKSFSGVKTWALNVGDPKQCKALGGLHATVTPGDGECVNVANKEDLKQVLEGLLAEIRELARAFATAAVPSVQTTSDQAIYVSSFTPLNNKSVWDGHLNAFLKPMPVTGDGEPDTDVSCGSGVEAGCHLWDAGAVIRSQFNGSDHLGNGTGQRRVAYSLDPSVTGVPWSSRLFDPIDCSDDDSAAFDSCTDLLEGMKIPHDTDDETSMAAAQSEANGVIATTLALKSHTLKNLDGSDGDTIQYLLGDLFHSNPVVVGTPVNVPYWVADLHSDGTACTDDETGNPGYRCFFRRHRFRRKMILAGSDDGMLHAFDAGRFRTSGTDPGTGKTLEDQYDNGTGHELFAFMPRTMLPTVRTLAQSTTHRFGVDGTPVVADVFVDPLHDGTPTAEERRWRTVAVTGLREGGRGYFALDLTQPDHLKTADDGVTLIPDDNGASNYVPKCMTSYSASDCGPVRYPASLWELTDSTRDSIAGAAMPPDPLPMDEDANKVPDLGDSWSTANIGRIRICRDGGTQCQLDPVNPEDDDDLEERHVAVFGGGMDRDAADKSVVTRGDWLYMVDVETGKLLYKRRLCSPYSSDTCVSAGAAVASPAAVDTDRDGFLDRIYQTTTGGFVFRVDLGADSFGNAPALADQITVALDPSKLTDPTVSPHVFVTVRRILPLDSAGQPLWAPRAIFDANWTSDGMGSVVPTASARQIYHPPSVFFAAELGFFGISFGTGNREDLWDKSFEEGRFYLLMDDTDQLAATDLPLDEGDLHRVLVSDPDLADDLLQTRPTGQKGWFLVLDEEERVITDSFALSGVTIFSSYQPEVAITESDCDPVTDPNCEELTSVDCGSTSFESDTTNRCARTGVSRNFVVGTVNANAFLRTATDALTRYEVVSTFVTNPFTEPGQSKNSDATGDSEANADQLTATDLSIMETLKQLFPGTCKFANYRVDIKTIAADTRVERIAPIPVCIVEKNWKEY